MILRDYQSEGSAFLTARRRACVVAPAGSGKTIIAAHAVEAVTRTEPEKKWRVGWFANTREQVEQGTAALGKIDWGNHPDRSVTIDIECVASMPDTDRYNLIVIDEGHHIPASTWHRLAVSDRAIVWGLTATPWHEDEDRNAIMEEVFREFHTIDREDVIASGHLATAEVWMHDLDLEDQFADEIDTFVEHEVEARCRKFRFVPRETHERRARWQITQLTVQANERRNERIRDLVQIDAGAKGQSVLVLVGSIDHGHMIGQSLGLVHEVVHSKMGNKKRAAAIAAFKSRELRVMIATSLADEGLDVPCASVLVLAAGGRSAGKIEQRTGRVLRPYPGKESGVIHDFMDRGAPLAYAQALARIRTYRKLGYTINK
jgi:superfamily II DNA or RNA helicase